MTTEINEATVVRMAALARLHLDRREIAALARDLAAILTYVDSLAELDLSGVDPTAHPFVDAMRLRPDEVRAPLGAAPLLANAPAVQGTSFRVPHIIGGDE